MSSPSSTGDLNYHMSMLESGAILHDWNVKNPRAIVILQHGYAEYAERFLHEHHSLILHLTKRNFRVMAMDLCGHGRSSGKRGLVDAEKAVADHVRVRKQAEKEKLPVFLFGHSLGGLITIGSVVNDPSGIRGVVMTGPALPPPTSKIFSQFLDFLAMIMPNVSIPIPKKPMDGLSRNPDVVKAFQDDPLTTKRQIPFLLAATATRVANAVWKNASQVEVPVLILQGTDDRHVDPKASKRLIDLLGSSDKQLSLYEKGRHELLDDLDRDQVLTDILAWFDGGAPAQQEVEDKIAPTATT